MPWCRHSHGEYHSGANFKLRPEESDFVVIHQAASHDSSVPPALHISCKPGNVGKFAPSVANSRQNDEGQEGQDICGAGANDGFNYSHTIWLEESQGWSGILIECNPEVRPRLLGQNRKAWVVDACLSKSNRPTTEILTSAVGEIGYPPSVLASLLDLSRSFPPNVSPTTFKVQTMPLFAILAALDVKVVDFFCLDVQSLELYILQTFPFDLIHVKMWVIEVNALSGEDRMALVILMRSKGYTVSNILEVPIPSIGYKVRVPNQDLIFISKRLEPN